VIHTTRSVDRFTRFDDSFPGKLLKGDMRVWPSGHHMTHRFAPICGPRMESCELSKAYGIFKIVL